MSADADFMGYVGARWPGLVRTLVLLGCPDDAADDVARDALARLQPAWSRLSVATDVDAQVHGELLSAWDRFRSTDDGAGRPAPLAAPLPLDPELVSELDRLTPGERAERVLAGGDRLRRATETVPVLAPPTGAELTGLRRRATRRRPRRRVAVVVPVVVVVAAVAGTATWLSVRGTDGHRLTPVAVVRQENPAGVVWAAGGVLHLAHVELALPALRQVAAFGPGAVYLDTTGRIVYVDDDGSRTQLGTTTPRTGFVASDRQGWVAWIDRTEQPPTLVVYEVDSHSVIGRRTLTKNARPVAIDGDTVYYVDADGARGWQPLESPPKTNVVEPADLLDVRARTRVYQIAPATIRIEPAAFDFGLAVAGTGARVSPDGTYVLSRLGGPDDSYGAVVVYDARSTAIIDSGIAPDEVALDASLGSDGTVTYLVARAIDRPGSDTYVRSSFSGRVQLRTCTFEPAGQPASCVQDTSNIPATGIAPILSH